jgi:hypothetical protein
MSGLEDAVSLERLSRYFAWAGNDHTRALELYAINTAVSKAFYIPLQMMEMALRNRCHAIRSKQFGPYWFDLPGILTSEQQFARALSSCEHCHMVVRSRHQYQSVAVACCGAAFRDVHYPLAATDSAEENSFQDIRLCRTIRRKWILNGTG